MPSPTPDKVIVTHKASLKKKYAAAGLTAIETALKNLILADAARGLVTVVVDLSSSTDATKYGFTVIPIASVGDAKKHKQAIDKIYTKTENPAYLMLLGAVDVIPHVPLKNPVFNPAPGGDPDTTAEGDIPYACSAAYSTDPRKYLTPDRVVGRLPDLTGGTDPAYLVKLIDVASGYTPRPSTDYDPFMGLSADVWSSSTTTSLAAIFGGTPTPQLAPPVDFPGNPAANLNNLSHFINCHGNTATPQFFGEDAVGNVPVALDATQLPGAIREGAIAAAECCYGAELYDPALSTRMGVCNTYLGEKAYGFFGSSTISYGPAVGNGQADLICQFFLKHVRSGASIGRACLLARLDYVSSCGGTVTGTDLKTIAQFNLLGDPSLTPVAATIPHAGETEVKMIKPVKKGMAGVAAAATTRFLIERFTRDGRRQWLRRYSDALAGVAYVVADAIVESIAGGKKVGAGVDPAVAKALRDVATEMGMTKPTVLRFDFGGGQSGMKATGAKGSGAKTAGSKSSPAPHRVHLVTERTEPTSGKNAVLIRGFEAIESDGMLTVRKFVSR